jgi:signal transduction histidine kinase/ligand-binding sensor domain-containing protein/CheY-like chemotaxis protein
MVIWGPTLTVAQEQKQFLFKAVNKTNGLSNNNPLSFLRDSKGFIWIGTTNGLNRYDGYSFKILKNNPLDSLSIRSNDVFTLSEDYNNNIWIGAGYYLEIYDPVTETIKHCDSIFNNKLKFEVGTYWKLHKDQFNNYWYLSSLQGLYKYFPKTDSLINIIKIEVSDFNFNNKVICDFSEDSNGDIWTINSDGLVYKIKNNNVQIIDSFSVRKTVNNLYKILIDSKDDLWVYDRTNNLNGGIHINTKSKEAIYFNSHSDKIKLTNDIITGMEEDNDGNIWMTIDHGGLNIYNVQSQSMTYLTNEPMNSRSLAEDALSSIYKDYEGFMWIGTYKQGFCYYHPNLFRFNHSRIVIPGDKNPRTNDIDNFAEDKKGNLWIGTNGGGIIYFDRKNNSYKAYRHNPQDINSISSDIIVGMLMDSKENLWVGTYGGGLNKYNGEKFIHFKSDSTVPGTITDDKVWDIYEDSEGLLWISTLRGGVNIMDPNTNKVTEVLIWESDSSIRSTVFFATIEDREGRMWFATVNGLQMLNKKTGKFTYYEYDPKDLHSLSNNFVLDILEDSRGLIWAATTNGISILDKPSGKFIRLNQEDGLPSNRILNLLEDDQKNIWVSTPNGLSNIVVIYNSKINKYSFQFKNYTKLDGLQSDEFNGKSAFKTRKGELIFGGNNGFNLFIPKNIDIDINKPNIVFTDFLINNKSYRERDSLDGERLLNKSITYIDEIELKYSENAITIEFSNLNYFHPERHIYQYKLENFNNRWIGMSSMERRATYTNLDPGTYIFKVRDTSLGNINEAQLKIIISPPYWQKWYFRISAILLLLIIAGSILYVIINGLKKQKKNLEIAVSQRTNELTELNSLLEERQEEIANQNEELTYHRTRLEDLVNQRTNDLEKALKKAEESDKLKSAFLANMSHEIRTPMNAIVGFSHLIKDDDLEKKERNEFIDIIQKNCESLLVIINDILDISKIEANQLAITHKPFDLVKTFREIENYYTLKKIHYLNIFCIIPPDIQKFIIISDETRIRQIIQNLVDNSIKYTDEGEITFGFENRNKFIRFYVKDSGIGIKPEDYHKVFVPFGKIDQDPSRLYTGTGLGLAICKKIIELLEGSISFDSVVGKGTVFKIDLPMKPMSDQEKMENQPSEEKRIEIFSNDIIVAEDEPANYNLIEKILRSTNLKITWAQNGKDAVDLVKNSPNKYALILMDIKMPVMDGITAFLAIQKINNSIPVIAVTAYAYESEKVEILRNNFADYITKPLKPAELLKVLEDVIGRKVTKSS